MYSYEEILDKMVKKYEQLAGFSINRESDIMIRLRVLAGELYNSFCAVEFVKRQMFVSGASGEYLDNHALTRGIYRKSGAKAKGEVTFSLSSAIDSDIVIDEGTVVSTTGAQVLSFQTINQVVLKAGTVSVKAEVVATKEGADHNVMKNTVCVMVTPPLYVDSVINEMYFTGGADKESDEELRNRVISSYKDISNGTNDVYYRRLAQSVEGVYSSSVVSGVRGPGTINIYIMGKGKNQVTKDQIDMVQELVDKNRELNVDALVLYASPRDVFITFSLEVFEGYDFEQVCEDVKEKITDFVDELGVSKPLLLSELGDVIFHTQGVKNYNFLQPYSSDVYPDKHEYCAVDMIEIRR